MTWHGVAQFWLEENYLSDAWEMLQCIRKSNARPAVMIMNPIGGGSATSGMHNSCSLLAAMPQDAS